MAKFKDMAKHTGMTLLEVGDVGVGMIASKKFLDFEKIFPNADKEGFFIKNQGAVKFIGGALGAAYVKNPWVKLFLFGIALEGGITAARKFTTNKEGVAFFEMIGRSNGSSSNDDAQRMLDAARSAPATMLGENPTREYPTMVAGPSVDLQDQATTYVSGMGMGAMDRKADQFGDY